MVLELNDSNFDSSVAKGIVLVDFWAPWCGPCKKMTPVVEKIAADNPDIIVAKVNVDEAQDIANKYSILSIPTIIILKDGEFQDQTVGQVPEQKILDKLNACR
ncbi:MAG: thioredoxin [Candidatus Cloacimonetes bacterium]|nr:thioredoxin [Candidatus Cloacimonadota bacterium]